MRNRSLSLLLAEQLAVPNLFGSLSKNKNFAKNFPFLRAPLNATKINK